MKKTHTLARKQFSLIAGLFAVGGLLVAFAQTTTSVSKTLEFDVATVKPSAPDERNSSMELQLNGGLRMRNTTLKQLITAAYGLREFQVFGGPSWIGTDHFDIDAKSDAPAIALDVKTMTDAQLKEMDRQFKERLKSLLRERFQLIARMETKDMPIYWLVRAKGGSKLASAGDMAGSSQRMRINRGVMTVVSSPVDSLASSLSNIVSRPVVNKTGLDGKFDWKLEWAPEPAPLQPGLSSDNQAAITPPDLSGPSIFTALQEQLGLKLESQKGPAPVLVIDRAEKPSAN